MTKGPSTPFGEALSAESMQLVHELRARVRMDVIPSNYDTDFNLYRWIMAAERLHRSSQDVIDTAEKALRNHLRYRRALQLDSISLPTWDDMPLYSRRLMPKGQIQSTTDSSNRLLWFIDYASISVESIAHTLRTSEMCRFQFWQFERMLQAVNEQEKRSGKLSSLRNIIDMTGYEINPFTMLFVSSGTMAYYTQLFHYEHYPELLTPVEMVNIARWIHVPYRLARTMMPSGFADRFRLHDGNFLPTLLKEISVEHIPLTLGGQADITTAPAIKVVEADYWRPSENDPSLDEMESLHVNARRRKMIPVNVSKAGTRIAWYFHTDADIYFGVFYQPDGDQGKVKDLDALEMCYPWYKMAARLVAEKDSIVCNKPGRYLLAFCNKHAWFSGRNVHIKVETNEVCESKDASHKRPLLERTLSF
uniref:CRAL-TRIO domain-containing protein n=1 Tax=Plectus sambesii TaxID=2011161 RepID=A0A914WN11_9BILA